MFAPYFIIEPEDVQNEMFVLYVAITRAEKYLKVYIDRNVPYLNFIIPEGSNTQSSQQIVTDTTIVKKDRLTVKPPKGYRCLLSELNPLRSTAKALLFQVEDKSCWLPISQIIESDQYYFVPDWLVKRNQLEKWVY